MLITGDVVVVVVDVDERRDGRSVKGAITGKPAKGFSFSSAGSCCSCCCCCLGEKKQL